MQKQQHIQSTCILRTRHSLGLTKEATVSEEVISLDDVSSDSDNDLSGDFEPQKGGKDWEDDLPMTAGDLVAMVKKAKGTMAQTKRMTAKATNVAKEVPKEEVVAYVLHGYKKEGHAHIVFSLLVTWENLCKQIYRASGFDSVEGKPNWIRAAHGYHIPAGTHGKRWKFEKCGARILDLNEASNLDALKAEVHKVLAKKATDNMDIAIIFLDEYLKVLRTHLGSKTASGGRGNKGPTLDLTKPSSDTEMLGHAFSNSFNVGNNISGTDMTANEKEKFDNLLKKLTACENCPHTAGSFCVKHLNGAHVHLTAHHAKSWAKSWANQLQGVDYHFPPSTFPLFAGFFKVPLNGIVDLDEIMLPPVASTPTTTTSSQVLVDTSRTNSVSPSIDTNALLAVAVMQLLQMQMQQTVKAQAPAGMVLNQASLIKVTGASESPPNLNYPSLDQFFERLLDSAKA
ncbi:hypothetical protein M422DRAFT_242429 [Sphaerobolus stellatus SS14]|nr:hypothetical protein M422DRAFT_242429 [Sphaerobolus stellatus SS14]